jgi:UDP-glucose 4-epimerase
MINMMLQGRQPYIYGDGKQMRCFSDIEDVLWTLNQLAFRDDVDGEIFNIGPDEEFVTINELAEVIANLLQFNLNPTFVTGRPQEVTLANCSADKARNTLGFSTSTTLRDSLSRMIDSIRETGTKPFRYHLDLEIINEKTPETWKDRLF